MEKHNPSDLLHRSQEWIKKQWMGYDSLSTDTRQTDSFSPSVYDAWLYRDAWVKLHSCTQPNTPKYQSIYIHNSVCKESVEIELPPHFSTQTPGYEPNTCSQMFHKVRLSRLTFSTTTIKIVFSHPTNKQTNQRSQLRRDDATENRSLQYLQIWI